MLTVAGLGWYSSTSISSTGVSEESSESWVGETRSVFIVASKKTRRGAEESSYSEEYLDTWDPGVYITEVALDHPIHIYTSIDPELTPFAGCV